jgi:hypothetical protein
VSPHPLSACSASHNTLASHTIGGGVGNGGGGACGAHIICIASGLSWKKLPPAPCGCPSCGTNCGIPPHCGGGCGCCNSNGFC